MSMLLTTEETEASRTGVQMVHQPPAAQLTRASSYLRKAAMKSAHTLPNRSMLLF